MKLSPVEKLLGSIPNRLQLAGGWIDQPFVNQHNPKPFGSMVVVQIEANFRPMDPSCPIARRKHWPASFTTWKTRARPSPAAHRT